MRLTEQEWIQQFHHRGALWIHDGNPKRPHALLTSGMHSSGFFNSGIVMEDPVMLDEIARGLMLLLVKQGFDTDSVFRVIGPAMGAITLANDLARHLSMDRDISCLSGFVEKAEKDGEPKHMVLTRTKVNPGDHILLVEDVLTTGGSVELTAKAVNDAGGIVVPFVAVIVNRSGLAEVGGRKIVALIDHPMPTWKPEECPLCASGSEAIRPKGTESWSRLNAAYP